MADPERTLLVYGDSNTHGTMPMADLQDARRLGPSDRWPGVLAARLGPGWRVIEEGLPGRTTVHPDPIEGVHKNGLAHLPVALDSHLPLDLVVIMLGTNDLKMRFAVPAVEIGVAVEQLVRTVRQSFAGPADAPPAVLLIAPPPVLEVGCLAEVFTGGAAKSTHLAAHYADVAQRWGVAFLDAGKVIRSSPLDGVHFEPEEHQKLGAAVAEAVLAVPL